MARNIFATAARFSFATTLTTFIALLSLFSIAGFFSEYNEICELLSHLRLAYCFGSLVLTLLLTFAGARGMAIVGLILLVVNSIPVLALYAPPINEERIPKIEEQNPSPLEKHEPNTALRLLQMNLWGGHNTDHSAALKLISDTKPDIIAFSEVTGQWATAFKQDLHEYRYQSVQPLYGGIALLSKYPFVSSEVRYSGEKHRPRVFSRIKIKDRIVTIISAHPLVPIHTFALRNKEFEEIAQETRAAKEPAILMGDLNCTPWSYYFDKLRKNGNLIDTEQGFGPQPSWNVVTPLLPIDHCLTSPDFVTINRYVCSRIGSDHFPVFVELKLREKR